MASSRLRAEGALTRTVCDNPRSRSTGPYIACTRPESGQIRHGQRGRFTRRLFGAGPVHQLQDVLVLGAGRPRHAELAGPVAGRVRVERPVASSAACALVADSVSSGMQHARGRPRTRSTPRCRAPSPSRRRLPRHPAASRSSPSGWTNRWGAAPRAGTLRVTGQSGQHLLFDEGDRIDDAQRRVLPGRRGDLALQHLPQALRAGRASQTTGSSPCRLAAHNAGSTRPAITA